MFIKRHLWAVVYGFMLMAFTIYLALDTFVIARVYTVVPQTQSNTVAQKDDSSFAPVQENGRVPSSVSSDFTGKATDISETSYRDENISITITEYQEYETSIYVADVNVSSAEYLQSAFAHNSYGRNVTAKTSEIAKSVGAILAINGDYCGAQERGYVIRNGVLYRDTASKNQEDLVIYSDGTFGIIFEDEITAEELLTNGAIQVLSFGPALVTDGIISVEEDEEVGKAKASNPRTAIGIIDNLHYVMVVSDGRTNESAGLSLSQLAEFMTGLGVTTAYNLDGGGSSTMYFNGKIINNPTTNGKSIRERSVSDIVYIGY